MSGEKPLILMTCDDGIESPGLRAAVRAMLPLGDVIVASPCEQQSGAGRSLPTFHDGAIHQVEYEVDGVPVLAYGTFGSPAQAVIYALVELVPRRPALCVSGINFGENVGSGVTASGTVGAAIEAADDGVPALAVSLQTPQEFHYRHSDQVDFTAAIHFTRLFARQMLALDMPVDVDVLKIDVPASATPDTPWRVTRLSRQRYFHATPSGREYLEEKRRLGYKMLVEHDTLEPDSDTWAIVVDRVVSVTPLSLDLTSRVILAELETLIRSPHAAPRDSERQG
ncbi:MAG: 5'/3'-nucleotidase SurE [Anaerolineae bacterium]|nr:5'/3'-nucleotidase SurE [Anaerolineae bacterium]